MLLAAIGRRYARQAQAMKEASEQAGSSAGARTQENEISLDDLFKPGAGPIPHDLGIVVKQ